VIRALTIRALTILVLCASVGVADPLIDALATEDPRALGDAVSAIERAPTTPELADALFAAGRATEDRLLDPARALAIYERILRELPDERVATAAQRRAERLRGEVGPRGEHARYAAELAQVIADADERPPEQIIARARALAEAPWPRAPDAALWLGDYFRRHRRFDEARAEYAAVVARWPGTDYATLGLRGGAVNAIDARELGLAEELARQVPAVTPADRILRDDLLREIRTVRLRVFAYWASWVALFAAIAGLLASLAEAMFHGGRRLPALRPPFEVLFLSPVAAVLIGVAYTGNLDVAPAVTEIALGGLGLAWLSGTTLDLLRARGRAVRLRSLTHVAACLLAAVSIGYLALTHDGLIDLMIETFRAGPEVN
jgi:tetratricopeptide (TPR) repeat protein